MTLDARDRNPFEVTTPETMQARDVVDLFVDVFSDFPQVQREGHLVVEGPRGSGKSMMFRYLCPDCQALASKCEYAQLPHFSFYVPVKETSLKLSELERLRAHPANLLINEHMMVLFIAEKALGALSTYDLPSRQGNVDAAVEFSRGAVPELLRQSGLACAPSRPRKKPESVSAAFAETAGTFERLFRETLSYARRLLVASDDATYDGPLCGYFDFLIPLLRSLRALPFIPSGPLQLLIDDADHLNLAQTTVLNSWIASRTTADASIKISTQYDYKTFLTPSRGRIEAPHDYTYVDVGTVYTASGKRGMYAARIQEIVKKRLERARVARTPEEYFPPDERQEEEIHQIADEYRRKHMAGEGRGARPSDDATRYARPDYIRSLGGTRKSSHSYSYSGLDQLMHVSSGVIRNFLNAAAFMCNQTASASGVLPSAITEIPPAIQDDVVRRLADELVLKDTDSLLSDMSVNDDDRVDVRRLRNLVQALGGTFHAILDSDRSERRVFSIALSDVPDEVVLRVLKLGIGYGYFQQSSIGNKTGTGRTALYILTRRLAPHFKLDPTSFAGYLFVTNAAIRDAMRDPQSLLKRAKRGGPDPLDLHQLRFPWED